MLSKIATTLSTILLFTASAQANDTIQIDDNSFGVFYESPMNTDKGLVLYVSNNNCIGKYRITTNELVVANGEVNARGPAKIIHFGNAKFRLDCGPQQALTLIRE